MWVAVVLVGLVLEAIVLFALAKEPLRRVWLAPVSMGAWESSPKLPSGEVEMDLPSVREEMSRIRGLLPFHGYDPVELNHPAFFLDPATRGRLLNGEISPKVGCGTYSNLLLHSIRARGTPARVVTGFTRDFSSGHVAVEAYFPSLGGWILLDPLYDSIFTDESGLVLGIARLRKLARSGAEIRVVQGPGPGDDPLSAPERILEYLGRGILDHLLAFSTGPYEERTRAPLIARALVLAEGDSPWWRGTQRLQFAALAIPVLFTLMAWILKLGSGS